jgi:hypothetical protein
MAIQFESSIDVTGSIDVSGSAYVDSLFIGNQSGQISNRVWFDNGSSNTPGLYFEGGQPKFIIYSSISNIFHDTYHPNADTWTNARTITIGNTGKSVNGSTNVSWTLAEIGAQAALTNPITGTGTTNYLSKFTGSTTLGNSLVYDNGTNVGIGTTSPTALLTLESSSTSPYPGIDIKSTSTYPSGEIRFLDSSGSEVSTIESWSNPAISYLQLNHGYTSALSSTLTLDDGYLYLSTAGSERMRINSAGNVGIGTTSPAGKLTIGSGLSTDNSTMFNVNGQYNDVGFNGGTSGLLTQGVWSFINSATWDQTRFYVQDQNNVASRLTFDFKGNAGNTDILAGTSTGNVGIGTSSPGSKLEVAGDTSSALLTLKSNNGGANDSFMRFYDESNGPSYSVGLDSSDAKFKIAYDSDGDSLTTGTKLVMDTAGNVGIGTTSPSEKLVVSGNTSITNNLYLGQNNTLKSCTYPAQYSLVVGQSNTLGGIANGIIGVSNTIECTNEPWLSFGGNFIAGINNTINNLYSHANAVFGQSNTVGDPTTPSNSVAGILVSGVGHSTFGDNSFAFGESCFTDINAKRSLTGGFDCNNFGYYGSVAIGAGATASTGNNQYAFGTGVTTPTSASAAYDSNQFVVGKFNVYSTGGRAHRFAVGNGFSDGFRSNAMNIDTFGRMGLGVTAPSYQLQLNSNSAAKPTSSSWTVVSDERVKTNIQDYTTGLTEILQINPKTFDYNGKAGFDTTTGNIGIIAQDVKDIMPETINTYNAKLNEDDTEDTELFNFDSHPVQFALINAIKELNSKIEALEAKIQILEGN